MNSDSSESMKLSRQPRLENDSTAHFKFSVNRVFISCVCSARVPFSAVYRLLLCLDMGTPRLSVVEDSRDLNNTLLFS